VDQVQICRFNYDFAKIGAKEFVAHILQQGLAAQWVLVGDDFRFGARRAGDLAMLRSLSSSYGFEVEEMSTYNVDGIRVSSTAVRKALSSDDLGLARRLLGRPYSISGKVVNGDKLGRRIGFPTANMQLRHNRPPLSGIFAVEVRGALDTSPQQVTRGVASLGVRPTVHEDGKPVLEVHLFDFSQEIYGQHLRMDFLHKLRDEEKYSDLDTLIRQIRLDVENAKKYFQTSQSVTA
jgi:riboflavin kinase/FMN adenylyltransferase